MNMNESQILGKKFRPHSDSLITVTSLEEDGEKIFDNGPKRKGQINLPLSHYYTNEALNTIDESPDTPTIVIDHHQSDPNTNNEVFGNLNIENENLNNIKSNSPIIQNNINSSIKYLSPPSFRSRRTSPDTASIASGASNRKRRMTEPMPSPSLRPKSMNNHKDPDAVSIGGCSIGRTSINNSLDNSLNGDNMRTRLVKFLSIMYALFIIIIGATISVSDLQKPTADADNIFIIITTLMGLTWIGFLHWDIQKYKKFALENLKPEIKTQNDTMEQQSINSEFDTISITTAVIFNTYRKPIEEDRSTASPFEAAYRFLHGKHSGNFYLKCGMTIFCFGSIVHEGVAIGQQIHYFSAHDQKCRNIITFLVHTVRCTFSFYQLFMAFKYSNILINRYKTLARFALMHLVATSISFWFSTIVAEAIDDYVNKLAVMGYNHTMLGEDIAFKHAVKHHMFCASNALLSSQSLEALPYLFPFTIEYNIILASVWYIVWTNIGKDSLNATGHHMRREVSQDLYGQEDVHYKSAIAINADCHASNRGLFAGLFVLLLTCVTIIVFYTTIRNKDYYRVGVIIYSVQIGLLTLSSFITVPLAYRQLRQLSVVSEHHCDNSSTAMDDLLVLVPLPFYYLHYLLAIKAEAETQINVETVMLILIYVLTIVQISTQSPFIVDGIRRCSNSKHDRFRKPGRELITFLLIINITLWILNTFELKSVEKYHAEQKYYGKFIWMIISHTTLPLMLFYRFHSSVCLSDIWKHAYEKDE